MPPPRPMARRVSEPQISQTKAAPPEAKGAARGVYSTAQACGLFLGGTLGGYLAQHFVDAGGVRDNSRQTAEPGVQVKFVRVELRRGELWFRGRFAARLRGVAVHRPPSRVRPGGDSPILARSMYRCGQVTNARA